MTREEFDKLVEPIPAEVLGTFLQNGMDLASISAQENKIAKMIDNRDAAVRQMNADIQVEQDRLTAMRTALKERTG